MSNACTVIDQARQTCETGRGLLPDEVLGAAYHIGGALLDVCASAEGAVARTGRPHRSPAPRARARPSASPRSRCVISAIWPMPVGRSGWPMLIRLTDALMTQRPPLCESPRAR